MFVCLFVYFHQLLVTMNNNKVEGSNRDKTIVIIIYLQIDMRYRNIDSSVAPVYGSWTISSKLSYLQVERVCILIAML